MREGRTRHLGGIEPLIGHRHRHQHRRLRGQAERRQGRVGVALARRRQADVALPLLAGIQLRRVVR